MTDDTTQVGGTTALLDLLAAVSDLLDAPRGSAAELLASIAVMEAHDRALGI